jgi:GTPase KRas protein
MGSSKVGKTALIIRYISNYFVADYALTINDMYRKNVSINDEKCTLVIVDTSGDEKYRSTCYDDIVDAQCFMVVYSVTDRESFVKVFDYLDEICNLHKGKKSKKNITHNEGLIKNIPIIVVGTKSDSEDRQVSQSEAATAFKKVGLSFLETSALLDDNITTAFDHLLCKIFNTSNVNYPSLNTARSKSLLKKRPSAKMINKLRKSSSSSLHVYPDGPPSTDNTSPTTNTSSADNTSENCVVM